MSADAGVDTGVQYPAPHPDAPQIVNAGGPVMSDAWTVVPVFYANDPQQGLMESYLLQMGKSTYFSGNATEYGATPYTMGNAIVITNPPTMITDAQIKTFLATQADGKHAGWPKATSSTAFVIFYPETTTIDDGSGTSCMAFGGYHSDGKLADATPFPYAVIPRCAGGQLQLETTVSHELLELATDPFPSTKPAYSITDDAHLVWALASTGGEVGDMCLLGLDSTGNFINNAYYAQRTWSNASAKAGHDPCVPVPANTVYFNAAPILPDMVTLDVGRMVTTPAVKIPQGTEATIDVALFSEGPTPPWKVTAELSRNTTAVLKFSWDQDTGQNGDVLHLTIKTVTKSFYGFAGFTLTSTDGMNTHKWHGLIAF